MDLPYVYSAKGQLKGPNLLADGGNFAMRAVEDYMTGNVGDLLSSAMTFGKKAYTGKRATEFNRANYTSPADVVSVVQLVTRALSMTEFQ